MAQASKAVRQKRRIKRELSHAYRMLDVALEQRDMARVVAYQLEQELKKKDKPVAAVIEKSSE